MEQRLITPFSGFFGQAFFEKGCAQAIFEKDCAQAVFQKDWNKK